VSLVRRIGSCRSGEGIIRPGQKVEAFAVGHRVEGSRVEGNRVEGGRVELVPEQPIQAFRRRFPDLPPWDREPGRL